MAFPAALYSQGARQVSFAGAGVPGDDGVAMMLDPLGSCAADRSGPVSNRVNPGNRDLPGWHC